jgi:hypothetical protein
MVCQIEQNNSIELGKMSQQQCPRDENGDFIDAITQEIIPENRLIVIPAGQTVHCFDLDSLYRWYRDHPQAGNPLTRAPLSPDIRQRLEQYGQTLQRTIKVLLLQAQFSFVFRVDADQSLGRVILDIFEQHQPGFEDLDSLFNYNFRVRLGDGSVRTSVYNLNLLTPLRQTNIRGAFHPVPNGIKVVATVLSGDPGGIRELIYRRWYQFAVDRDLEWLVARIPPQFRQLPQENREEPSTPQFRQMAQMIYTASGSGLELIVSLVEYIQSQNPRISAEQANVLVGLLPVLPNIRTEDILRHLIYSRVVDKQNLQPSGISGEYYQRRNEPPNYQIVPGRIYEITRLLPQLYLQDPRWAEDFLRQAIE